MRIIEVRLRSFAVFRTMRLRMKGNHKKKKSRQSFSVRSDSSSEDGIAQS